MKAVCQITSPGQHRRTLSPRCLSHNARCFEDAWHTTKRRASSTAAAAIGGISKQIKEQ
jgi:hypothetical protein